MDRRLVWCRTAHQVAGRQRAGGSPSAATDRPTITRWQVPMDAVSLRLSHGSELQQSRAAVQPIRANLMHCTHPDG